MSHYYDEKQNIKSERKTFEIEVLGEKLKLESDNGVFSKDHLDFGSRLLIEEFILPLNLDGDILDLGCGYGIIGISISKKYNKKTILVDINERAIELAKKNIKLNNVNSEAIKNDGLEGLGLFQSILTNPPIRAGKKVVYQFFNQSYEHLIKNGELWIVMRKQHGALSALNELNSIFNNSEIVKKKNGFLIIRCIKN